MSIQAAKNVVQVLLNASDETTKIDLCLEEQMRKLEDMEKSMTPGKARAELESFWGEFSTTLYLFAVKTKRT